MPPHDDASPVEIELKLALRPQDLPRLRQRLQALGPGRTARVDNQYFDTADRLLAQHRMALRLRRIGRRWVQTLKTESGATPLARRGEWELPARGALEAARFAGTPLAALLRAHPQARLAPVFRSRFRRTVWLLDGGTVEAALDDGEITAGSRRAPILELELELKSGPADRLYRIALDLAGRGAQALALLPAGESKAARGYRLAAGEAARPVKANAGAVVGRMPAQTTVSAALRTVVERGTTVLLANAAGCSTAEDAEFVHQARVALRRVRSAARLLGKAAGWPKGFDRDLRWIARTLGTARDWDVFVAQTLPRLAAEAPRDAPWTALSDGAVRRRQRAAAALRAALASARLARLALRLLRWAQRPAESSVTLAAVAAGRLARLHRRLARGAEAFAALPVARQHRLRIRAKRLRYGLDLLGAALPAQPTARYRAQLARVQDELGAVNDAVVAAALLERLARAARADAAEARHRLDAWRRDCARRAEAALAELQRLPRPWE